MKREVFVPYGQSNEACPERIDYCERYCDWAARTLLSLFEHWGDQMPRHLEMVRTSARLHTVSVDIGDFSVSLAMSMVYVLHREQPDWLV